jgi:ATP-dependent DNA helicase RecQ
VGNLEKSDTILKHTVEKIQNKEVEINRITKTVLVIDEAQDMNEDEFNLISTLINENEEMRVIAVGDDDQNIYEFRGANSKYLKQLIDINGAEKYELIENYRSKSNLVDFANQFATGISNRLKNTPIIANQPENGKIKVARYRYNNLIMPFVNDLINTTLRGTTCVLTKTNDEALHITGLLLKSGIQAKLIQTNDAFKLYNLAEIRSFVTVLNTDSQAHVITNDAWENAKRVTAADFKHSANWIICENMVKDFEATSTKTKYRSDLEVFIQESKLEDFYSHGGEIIFVSTIHKAKGKEFDNVFLMLENFASVSDDDKRQLYVAITRAKQNLTIHLNANHFDHISTVNLDSVECLDQNQQPTQLAMQLTHEDVKLDHFMLTQPYISGLMAGDTLIIDGDECATVNRKPILKFSKSFVQKINSMGENGYKPRSAEVNFIIYWQKEGSKNEIKIVLPKLYFEKT